MNEAAYFQFLETKKPALRRIAYRTRQEVTPEDVSQSAWLIAIDIEERLGRPIDFADRDDQETVIAWLYNKFVNYAEKRVRFAVKIDQASADADSESPGERELRTLAAPLDSDPLENLDRQEEEQAQRDLIDASYSEAAAYALLLLRFQWDWRALAAYLHIVVETLRIRVERAASRARIQPSLFDGIDTIDPAFQAARGRHQVAVNVQVTEQKQKNLRF